MPKIPEVGDDGLYRLDCPSCGKLVLRFDKSLKGGPIEEPCRNTSCKDKYGKRTLISVTFNEIGPEF